jgi:hypothetical protein
MSSKEHTHIAAHGRVRNDPFSAHPKPTAIVFEPAPQPSVASSEKEKSKAEDAGLQMKGESFFESLKNQGMSCR